MVSDNNSDDDYIGAHQVPAGEPIVDNGPPDSHIPPEPPPHKSPEEAPDGAHSEESPEGATPGRPIWEREENNILRRVNLHKIFYALDCGINKQPVHEKQLSKSVKG